jgi:hypothetical protein
MMKPSLFVLFSFMALALPAGLGLAADKNGSKQLVASGLSLMKASDFAGAADNFERAAALDPAPKTLLDLASCYKALHRYQDALDVLKRLQQEFAGKLKPDLQQASTQLGAEIRSMVATLVLAVEPSSAQVILDGKELPAGLATGSFMLAPGDHTVEVSMAGYVSQRRSIRLASGAQSSEGIILEREPGTLAVHSDPSGATVWVDGEEKAQTPIDQPLALTPGNHRIALRMIGRMPAERTVEIRAGERTTVALALEPVEVATPPLAASTEPAAVLNAALAASIMDAARPPPPRYWRIVAWSSAAGALLAGGTALVLWKGVGDYHFKKMKEFDQQYMNTGDPKYDRDRRTALSNAQMSGYAAIGCGIGAGVLAATAVAAFFFDAREDQAEKTSSLSLAPTGIQLGF